MIPPAADDSFGMRALFLLYHYPSSWGSAAARNQRMVRGIAKRCERAFVLTASPAPYPDEPRVKVSAVARLDYRSAFGRDRQGGAFPETVKRGALAQFAIRLINTFPINLIFGEGGVFYILRLARQGERIIRGERITVLYSSYRPMADHAAAWWLKRRHPGLTWIADFRDLPVDPHTRHVLFPGWHRRLYRRMFQRADILTTVSDGLAKHLAEGHPHVVVTRNGLPEDWRMPQPVPCPHFTIAYTGSMFLDTRDPAPLFDALAGLIQDGELSREDLRIVYAGKDGAEWRQRAATFGLDGQCEDRGLVPPGEARAIQRDANVNLLLTYSSATLGGVLTGKMIEYVAAGNPVLAISKGGRDAEIDNLLTSISLGRTFTGDAESRDQIRGFISGEYRHWKRTGMNRKPADEVRVREVFSPAGLLEPLWAALARR